MAPKATKVTPKGVESETPAKKRKTLDPPDSSAKAEAKRSNSKKGSDKTPEKPQPKAQEKEKAPKKATAKASNDGKPANAPIVRSNTPRALVPEDKRALKILYVNVAGLRGLLNNEKKSAELQALISREDPDLLGIAEHKLKEEDVEEQEAKLFELLQPVGAFVARWTCCTVKKGYSGVAVLVRVRDEGAQAPAIADPDSIKNGIRTGLGDARDQDDIMSKEGRVLTLCLDKLTILLIYSPNSGAELGRLEYRTRDNDGWDTSLASYCNELRSSRGVPVVVIGDLNVAVGTADIHNFYPRPGFDDGSLEEKPLEEQYVGLKPLLAQAGLTPAERASFPKLVAKAGLCDTFRHFHPNARGVFSYFSQRVVQNRSLNRGLRLDYVLADTSLLETASAESVTLIDSFICDEGELVADHAAIGCTFQMP